MIPRSPEKRITIRRLYKEGATIECIADAVGGSFQGVRGTIRKMRASGYLPARRRVGNRWLV